MNISHIGNLWTITDFKLKDGSQIRLKVGIKKEITVANQLTYFCTHVYKKGFKCKNWIYSFESKNMLDDRILAEITEEQLYNAYYNHWQKLNPIRIFSSSQINSELTDFKVREKTQTKHYAY